jgi:hypothetical protein
MFTIERNLRASPVDKSIELSFLQLPQDLGCRMLCSLQFIQISGDTLTSGPDRGHVNRVFEKKSIESHRESFSCQSWNERDAAV